MACCILGALLVAQLLAFWRSVKRLAGVAPQLDDGLPPPLGAAAAMAPRSSASGSRVLLYVVVAIGFTGGLFAVALQHDWALVEAVIHGQWSTVIAMCLGRFSA